MQQKRKEDILRRNSKQRAIISIIMLD